ncbi:potassium channel family protein [Bifidobacterium scaligerum]|uniref:Voltage-gated potassium channel n=1 Tax=Bifidobacterium scaligerum TaxID=2052656 RepID=A0A2M9HNY0_9BIFI|nr:potassium channel family protein [Bifidobacterium scaligerum]PJM78489.1 voltage-gated potassium channel [Bifidobacterium scaligerum]
MGLKTWKKWTDWPLMMLSVMFLVAYSWEILARTHVTLCENVINAIWVAFVIDYAVSLWLADNRWRWFKRNLFALLTIALPMFRPLRLLRLLTVLHVLNRTSGMAVRGRITVYSFGAVTMLMYVGALAVYSVERGAAGSTITDFGTALWWSFVTVTTVGYGDVSPVTFQGKIIAVALMFAGIALIGIVTATLASWIVDQVNLEAGRREDAREKEVAKEAVQAAIATAAATTETASGKTEIELLRDEVRQLTAAVAGLREELERR